MSHVEFTHHLKRFFPDLQPTEVEGSTVAEVIQSLDRRHPGLAHYLVDEAGALRPHVNVFLDEEMVTDRQALSDAVGPQTNLYILQALSGG